MANQERIEQKIEPLEKELAEVRSTLEQIREEKKVGK